jgi:outer membrane protein
LKLLNIAGALLLSGSFIASSAVQASDYKIAVVNPAKVLESAPQYDAALEKLEKEFEPKNRALISVQKEVKDLLDQLEKDGEIMAVKEKKDLERDVVFKRQKLKSGQDDLRVQLNLRRNEELGELQKEILKSIQTVAKEEQFDLVIGNGIFYASDRIDITQKVIDRMKKDYKK